MPRRADQLTMFRLFRRAVFVVPAEGTLDGSLADEEEEEVNQEERDAVA